MYEVDSNGQTWWLGPAEELGTLRNLVPMLRGRIAELERQLADKADAVPVLAHPLRQELT